MIKDVGHSFYPTGGLVWGKIRQVSTVTNSNSSNQNANKQNEVKQTQRNSF